MARLAWVGVWLGCAAHAGQAEERAGSKLSEGDWAVLERASFGPTKEDVRLMEAMGRASWIESQLQFVGDDCLPAQAKQRINELDYQSYDPALTMRSERQEVLAAKESGGKEAAALVLKSYKTEPVSQAFERRSLRALYCANPLQEKMASFWFNQFNVYARKAQVALMLPDYEEKAIRPFVFAKFEQMALAVLTHPAMLQYLDNAQNIKGRINENYARELMELHTMGAQGGYTQKDVQELARILTGVGQVQMQTPKNRRKEGARDGDILILPNGFVFDMAKHDQEAKVFLGKAYPAGGGFEEVRQALAQLASHPSTARHLSRRMAQYFVSDAPSEALVEKMASAYMKSGGSLSAMSGVMLRSAEFAQPNLTKFKEPQEWVYSAMRLQYGSDMALDMRPLYKWMSDLGQPTYMKLTPDGYAHLSSEWASADQVGKRFEISKQMVGAAGQLFSPKEDKSGRAEAARARPSDPSGLWAMRWRYSSPGLEEALKASAGERESRALVLAAPGFMRK